MRIAIYCGSSIGSDEIYEQEVRALGKHLVENDIDIVYGGGKVGLMGVIADSVLENGGKVYGVIPEKLKDKELAHEGLTELTVTKDMHERKAKMIEYADAFIALPGGAGTFEEIFEAWVWAQLGFHDKPCAFYNINGFYDKLFDFMNSVEKEGFLYESLKDMLIKTDDKQELLNLIKNYEKPHDKWT